MAIIFSPQVSDQNAKTGLPSITLSIMVVSCFQLLRKPWCSDLTTLLVLGRGMMINRTSKI